MSEPTAGHIDHHKIMEATEQLPFPQVEALWLVDICGMDYATAAVTTRITFLEFAGRLHAARRSIRCRVASNC